MRAAAGGAPVHIRDPQCVSKTFPDYFSTLASLVSPESVQRNVMRDQARS